MGNKEYTEDLFIGRGPPASWHTTMFYYLFNNLSTENKNATGLFCLTHRKQYNNRQ
jgi:hypothetical protein